MKKQAYNVYQVKNHRINSGGQRAVHRRGVFSFLSVFLSVFALVLSNFVGYSLQTYGQDLATDSHVQNVRQNFLFANAQFSLSGSDWKENVDLRQTFALSVHSDFFVAENENSDITVSAIKIIKQKVTDLNANIKENSAVLNEGTYKDAMYKIWQNKTEASSNVAIKTAKVAKTSASYEYIWTFTNLSKVLDESNKDKAFSYVENIDNQYIEQFIDSIEIKSQDSLPDLIVAPSASPIPRSTPAPSLKPSPEPTAAPSPNPSPDPTVGPSPSPSGSVSPNPTPTPPNSSSDVKLNLNSIDYDYNSSKPTYKINLELENGYFTKNIQTNDISFDGVWSDGIITQGPSTSAINGYKRGLTFYITKSKAAAGQGGKIYLDKDKISDNNNHPLAKDVSINIKDGYIPSIISNYNSDTKDLTLIGEDPSQNNSLYNKARKASLEWVTEFVELSGRMRMGRIYSGGFDTIKRKLPSIQDKLCGSQCALAYGGRPANDWIYNAAATGIYDILAINLLEKYLPLAIDFFLDLFFDAPLVFKTESSPGMTDPTKLDSIYTALNSMQSQINSANVALANRIDALELSQYLTGVSDRIVDLKTTGIDNIIGEDKIKQIMSESINGQFSHTNDSVYDALVADSFGSIYRTEDINSQAPKSAKYDFKDKLSVILNNYLSSNIPAYKGTNIFELNDKMQSFKYNFNSETFMERLYFTNATYGIVMPWLSLLTNSMIYDIEKNKQSSLEYEAQISSIDTLLTADALNDNDVAKLKQTKEKLAYFSGRAKMNIDLTNKQLDELMLKGAQISQDRQTALKKVITEIKQFYDLNKPSVYNYRLGKYFVPIVFNSMAYHGIDNSIPVSLPELYGDYKNKNNSMMTGDKSKNPYIYYDPDKTLKNTFSKHLFSDSQAEGISSSDFYNKIVVAPEDMQKLYQYDKSVNSGGTDGQQASIDNAVSQAGFQFISLDYNFDKGFRNKCENYIVSVGHSSNQKCLENINDLSPRNGQPLGEGNQYYRDLDTLQKFSPALYTNEYKSAGWATADTQDYWPSYKNKAQGNQNPYWYNKYDTRMWDYSTQYVQYANESRQYFKPFDSSGEPKSNLVELATIYTGSDLNRTSSSNVNVLYRDYNFCKNQSQNSLKCIRYFNTSTVNWLEYRATNEVPQVNQDEIDINDIPIPSVQEEKIQEQMNAKNKSFVTREALGGFFADYYSQVQDKVTYYEGMLEVIKEKASKTTHRITYGYNKQVCGKWSWIAGCDTVWVETGWDPAITYAEDINYCKVGKYWDARGKGRWIESTFYGDAWKNGRKYTTNEICEFVKDYHSTHWGINNAVLSDFTNRATGYLDDTSYIFKKSGPENFVKAFYSANNKIKGSEQARAMIRYAAKQTAENLGIHGFSNLVNLPTRGDLAPRKHILIIFLNIFKALSGDKDAKQFLQNAGISSDTLPGLSQRLYSDWTGADLARLPYDLKDFWVRGEKKIGSVIYHADAYQNVDALTADLSTLTVRPMIKQAGVNDWTWGGQKQAKAPFPYYFLEWAGLDKSLDYNMMVKICAYDYSGDTKCYNTAVKTTKPKASNQSWFW